MNCLPAFWYRITTIVWREFLPCIFPITRFPLIIFGRSILGKEPAFGVHLGSGREHEHRVWLLGLGLGHGLAGFAVRDDYGHGLIIIPF